MRLSRFPEHREDELDRFSFFFAFYGLILGLQ
jgi:hypothetical protein